MPLLKAEAEKLSNNDLQRGVIEELIDKDDFFALLPFVGTKGKAFVYNRENTLSEAQFIDPNSVVPEGAATFTEVTTHLRVLAGDVDVDKFLATSMDDTNDQLVEQIASKMKGIRRKFQRTLVNGDNGVTGQEFDGLKKIVDGTGNIMYANSSSAAASLSLEMLDELADMVPNGTDCFVMRRGTYRALKALQRAAGGNTASMFQVEDFGGIPAHDGIPVIINDFIGTEDFSGTPATDIYAVRLNEADGFHGLFGGEAGGIVVEDIGTVQNKDAWRTRVKWYCGCALKSTQSLAVLSGISNV